MRGHSKPADAGQNVAFLSQASIQSKFDLNSIHGAMDDIFYKSVYVIYVNLRLVMLNA